MNQLEMDFPENKVTDLIQGADRSKWMLLSNHNIKRFTKGEIEIITNNYENMVGRGGFGEVFEGVLEDKSKVAVKRFIQSVKENFAKELTIHREINHKNVVRLLGYCVEDNALMIVTEYISNGNLSDALHRNNSHMPLDIRLRVATECAQALAYMHSYMYTQVIHGDIKPANILLDDNYNAKLSDFGISRLVNTGKTLYTENLNGSIGYMDPLFALDGCLTAKSDVYSFGVVLVELITRKKVTTDAGRANIIYLCTDSSSRGNKSVREMFDAQIASKNNIKILEGIARLADDCLRMDRDTRPGMIDVVERLRMLRKVSHQDLQQRINLFSWMRRSRRAPPSPMTIPTTTLQQDLCRQFSYEEMKAATRNFDKSCIVSQGEYGTVYRGQIDGGAAIVAIKCLKSQVTTNSTWRSNLRHPHLVPFIGYCKEMDKTILVYKYMAHGSLRELLYNAESNPPLTWKQRLGICIGAARGLHYLHSQRAGEHAIIHRNVKLSNTLLDENWVAKISDNIDTDPFVDTLWIYKGNWPDPEYRRRSQVTEKSDVYSFGAVLLEVLSARPVFLPNCSTERRSLLSWVVRCKEEGNIGLILDPYIKEEIDQQCLDQFAETALRCIAKRGVDRPCMEDVISDLEHTLLLQENADVSKCLAWSGDAMDKGTTTGWQPDAPSSSSS